jgi:CubicO group peptidase (beta-lactamase class C family)
VPLGTFLEGYLVPGGAYYHEEDAYAFAPGHAYRYCNVAVSLAAYMVEAASGIAFETWSRDRIFAPLGMTDTRWRLSDVRASQVATPPVVERPPHVLRASPIRVPPTIPTTSCARPSRAWPATSRCSFGAARSTAPGSFRRIPSDPCARQVPTISDRQGLVWYWSHPKGRELIGHNGRLRRRYGLLP